MKTRRYRTYAFGGFLCSVSVVTVCHAIVEAEATRRIETAIARLPGVHVGSVSVDPWNGRISLGDVSARAGTAKITVGRVMFRGPAMLPQLIMPAQAADGTATIENVEIDIGTGKLRMPKLEARGTNLGDADLAKIFDPKSTASVADRIAQFSADEVSIPEMTNFDPAHDVAVDIVVKDTKLHHVEKGKIAAYETGQMTISVKPAKGATEPAPTFETTLGHSVTRNFDVGFYARVLTEPRHGADEAFAP